jgi:SSS family solute:Na+ symporter
MNPGASKKQVSRTNYSTGIIVVVISVVFGIFALDVNSILQWIVSALWGSYIASNVLKWYWWRFNGNGFFWGMVSGIIPALIFPNIFHTLDLYYFPLILVISIAGCIIGTYTAPPTNEKTLMEFYRNVRPWGFWKPIHEKVVAAYPDFKANRYFRRDMFNVFLGTIAQTALVIFPIYIILKQKWPLVITVFIILVCGFILKKTWWDTLPDDKPDRVNA